MLTSTGHQASNQMGLRYRSIGSCFLLCECGEQVPSIGEIIRVVDIENSAGLAGFVTLIIYISCADARQSRVNSLLPSNLPMMRFVTNLANNPWESFLPTRRWSSTSAHEVAAHLVRSTADRVLVRKQRLDGGQLQRLSLT